MKVIIQGQITILEKMNSMNFEAVEKMAGRGANLTDHAFQLQNEMRAEEIENKENPPTAERQTSLEKQKQF